MRTLALVAMCFAAGAFAACGAQSTTTTTPAALFTPAQVKTAFHDAGINLASSAIPVLPGVANRKTSSYVMLTGGIPDPTGKNVYSEGIYVGVWSSVADASRIGAAGSTTRTATWRIRNVTVTVMSFTSSPKSLPTPIREAVSHLPGGLVRLS